MKPCIYIVMAVYLPDPDYLSEQMRSIADQTHDAHRLVAVIADGQSARLVSDLAAQHGLDLALVTPDTQLDAVRAFEAGLAHALVLADTDVRPEGAPEPLIALCDQDDIWHKDRLAKGVMALASSGADLVHSDARLVDGDGALIHASMFAFERRRHAPGLRGLLYRNTITGMTTLMRLPLVRVALPFPGQSGVHFYHDLWLGLLASAMGGVHLIDAPMVDYRQHGKNAVGAVDRQHGFAAGLRRKFKRPDMTWLRREAASFALAKYLAQSTDARLSNAVQSGMIPAQSVHLGPLKPFLRRMRGSGTMLWDAAKLLVTGSPALARIATGFAVVALGRTVWSLRDALGQGMSHSVKTFDNRLWTLAPGVPPEKRHGVSEDDIRPKDASELIDLRKTARWTPDFSAAQSSLTILVPTLNPTEIFAGVVTALDFGLGLAKHGFHVRFVATDLPISSVAASRGFLLRRLNHEALQDGTEARISLFCGASGDPIPAHRDDVFLATAWWTAHLADRFIADHQFSNRRFIYLIQDFEPNFYAWGQEFADAMASYQLGFRPVFNTTLLQAYFAQLGFDFADAPTPEGAPMAFHPAITISRYADGQRAKRSGPRKLALYGRPEVARNMFGTAIEALDLFIRDNNLGPDDIVPVSVGLKHGPVTLANGVTLRSQGKLPWEAYPGFLLDVDLGLSLMYSPHPSHPPIEMAASGVRVVTNGFGPKDLSQLTPAILSAEPTGPALAAALSKAWSMPPPSAQERRIDLSRLGTSPDQMIAALAHELSGPLHQEVRA